MATRLRLNRSEDVMSKGIIHNINKVAELPNRARVDGHNLSDEQQPWRVGYAYTFSNELACLLTELSGEGDFA